MNDLAILAASYLGPAGYGNDLTGLRAHPDTAPAVTTEGPARGHLVRFGRPMFIGAREWLSGAQSGQDVRAPGVVSGCSPGLRPWPAPLDAAFQQGDLAELHWSLLFASDPARFARMDLMSRLGLMAVELLDAGLESLPVDRRDRIGICLETCAGSLATDLRFLQNAAGKPFCLHPAEHGCRRDLHPLSSAWTGIVFAKGERPREP